MIHYGKSSLCRRMMVALTLCLLGGAPSVEAGMFNIDGYVVDVQCKYRKTEAKLYTKGTIKGGQQCKNLEVTMRFTNGNELITAEKSIINYEPTIEGTSFKSTVGYVLLPSDENLVKRWRAYRVKLKCVQ